MGEVGRALLVRVSVDCEGVLGFFCGSFVLLICVVVGGGLLSCRLFGGAVGGCVARGRVENGLEGWVGIHDLLLLSC